MSHFREIEFKAQRDLLLRTLDAMGLHYTEHPEGVKMDTAWKRYEGNDRTAHIIIDRDSLHQRSECAGYRPVADIGFSLNNDGTYSPIIDEYVCRGKNENFGQQLAQTYFELAVRNTSWEVVETTITDSGKIQNKLRKRQQQQVRAW